MIVYLDTLAILFRSYYSNLSSGLVSKKGVPTGALYGLSNTLLKLIKELSPDHIVACFDSPEKTLREESFEQYKANRKEPEEDLVLQIQLSKKLLEDYGVHIYQKPGYEADDILGTLATKSAQDGEDVVVVTCDGDIFQLTTDKKIKVYFLRKGMSDFLLFDEKEVEKKNGYEAKYITDYKALAGDASDNIPGVKGIGKTTAIKLINQYGDIDNIYEALQKDKIKECTQRILNLLKEGKEMAYTSKDLATIHNDVPIKEFNSNQPKWIERIEKERVNKTLEEYNFNSLSKRINDILGHKEEKPISTNTNSNKGTITETSIALWILDSTKTLASETDILEHIKKNTIEEAQEYIFSELKKKGRYNVYKDIEEPLIPILTKMKETGILIDKAKLESLHKEYQKDIDGLKEKIYKLAGEEFNLNSPKQLGEILFDKLNLVPKGRKKTAGGGRTTKEATLITLMNEHSIIPLILDYRKKEKLRSTYIDALPNYIQEDGRIHARLNQNGTTTGRFSSTDPNLQNIPTRGEGGKEIREVFVSGKGKKLVSIDYSQMELRLAAILSKDQKLIEAFNSGMDIHTAVAAKMFAIDKDKITTQQRANAKEINFGILYGMGAQALRQNLKIPLIEAEKFLTDYKKAFPTLFEYLDSIKTSTHKTGQVETLFGRVREIEGIHSNLEFIKAQAERMAVNSVIQGTAADIIKIAMIKIDEMLKKEKLDSKTKLLLQIHDELLFEIEEDSVEISLEKIIKVMESVLPEDKVPVRLFVESNIGDSWGSLK